MEWWVQRAAVHPARGEGRSPQRSSRTSGSRRIRNARRRWRAGYARPVAEATGPVEQKWPSPKDNRCHLITDHRLLDSERANAVRSAEETAAFPRR